MCQVQNCFRIKTEDETNNTEQNKPKQTTNKQKTETKTKILKIVIQVVHVVLKVRFLRMEIFIQMMRHHLIYLGFKFNLNRLNYLDTIRDYVFGNCLDAVLCNLNYGYHITSHIFISIFQMVHFSVVKFTRGNEKNMSFLLI